MNFTNQQRKALHTGRDLIINAGAGSGKTTILVERYLRILETGPEATPQNILAITYTEKAAAEMKQRVLEGIRNRIETNPASAGKFYRFLRQTDDLRISTIHSFCRRILLENSLISGFLPETAIIDSPEKEALFERVFWHFFQHYLPEKEAAEPLKKALQHFNIPDLKDVFSRIYFQRSIYLPFLREMSGLTPNEILAKWKELRQRYYRWLFSPLWINPDATNLLQILQTWLNGQSSATAVNLFESLSVYLSRQPHSGQNEDALISATQEMLGQFFTNTNSLKVRVGKLLSRLKDEGVETETTLIPLLNHYHRQLVKGKLDNEASEELAATQSVLSRLLLDFFSLLDTEKRKLRVRDFEDLLLETESLLERNPGLRRKLRRQIRWILVDEFQDTDPVQNKIISLLTEQGADEGRPNLFLVGDPKQSIFSFRKADVTLFEDRITAILNPEPEKASAPLFSGDDDSTLAPEEKRGLILLPDNFRSLPELIKFYNFLFERVFRPESRFDVNFAPLSAARVEANGESRMELHLLSCLPKTSVVDAATFQAREMADIIHSLTTKPAAGSVKEFSCRFGDIAVLVRERNRLPQIEQIFNASKIPYKIFKGRGFFQKQEILDVYSLLKAVADPEDDFSLIAALRTPYVGLSDEGLFYLGQFSAPKYSEKLRQLFRYLSTGDISLFRAGFQSFLTERDEKPALSEHDAGVLEYLKDYWQRWQSLALQGDFTLLLNDLIESLQIRAVMAAEDDGAQKAANLQKLTEMAYQFQQKSSGRIADFLETLQKLIEGNRDEGEAIPDESREDRVQILTIHAAKGLEFPVVLLPFMENRPRDRNKFYSEKNSGLLITDDTRARSSSFILNYFKHLSRLERIAEEKRLFYVAATRARDQIYFIGALEDENNLKECSLKWLLDAVAVDAELSEDLEKRIFSDYGLKIVRRDCPPASEPDTVSSVSAFAELEQGVSPPGPLPESAAAYSRKISLPWPRREYSATQLMIFRENPERYIQHFYLHRDVLESDMELEAAWDESGFKDEAVPERNSSGQMELPFNGMSGLLWGTLLHKVLENYHLRPETGDAAVILQALRKYGVAGSDVQACRIEVQKIVRKFRETPLGRFLLKAEQRSEVRVSLHLESATLVGVFDRVFRNEAGNRAVLDFKTNRLPRGGVKTLVAKYRPQMEYYGLLLHHLFPDQEEFPVSLFFLPAMQEHRFVFHKQELSGVRENLRQTFKSIIRYEQNFFEISPGG